MSFFRLDDLLHVLRRDAHVPARKLTGKKYMSSSLLILDEVGFQPLTREDAALLFRLVSCRYGKGSTIITTNKSVQDWPEILAGDEVMATALLCCTTAMCSTCRAGASGRVRSKRSFNEVDNLSEVMSLRDEGAVAQRRVRHCDRGRARGFSSR